MPKHSLGLTLVQMRALVSVVEAGGFTSAAQLLHVQQPTVSAEIQRLEQRCGFELLERRGGTRLTKEGRRLYEEARAVLAAAEKWESVLLELQNSRRGRAQIGSGHTIGTYVLPRLVAQFRAVHPGIEVGLRTNDSAASLDALVKGELDLAIVKDQLALPDFVSRRHVFDDQLMIVAPPGHSLAGRQVTIDDLAYETFVVLDGSSEVRQALVQAFLAHGHTLKVLCEFGQNEALKQAVESGLGPSILSRFAVARDLEEGRLTMLDVEEFPIPRAWDIIWVESRTLTEAAKRLRDFVLADDRLRLGLPVAQSAQPA
jgi:DNA-binding transcriptional LysR family regulator